MDIQINKLLELMLERQSSDLHLETASPPVFRIDGTLTPLEDTEPLSGEELEKMFEEITTSEQRDSFENELELDFAYSIPGLARFRVNVLRQREAIGIVFRLVPMKILTIEQLGLPQICRELVLRPKGLVLVTGSTGSGKSTTLAAMIDYANENSARSIITIEDPIEYLHHNKKCIISQRNVGDDTKSFATALKHALRHDPDIIVVGEMRDLETISTAITAAETGHLVLGTLHTISAAQTVERIVDVFPANQQPQIRLQLSEAIQAILSQTLVAKAAGKGRVAAVEILVGTPAIRNLIREKRTHELPGIMEIGLKDGMQTMINVLADLVKRNIVTREEALNRANNPEKLSKLLMQFNHTNSF
jgi:twitching motility protein PilT